MPTTALKFNHNHDDKGRFADSDGGPSSALVGVPTGGFSDAEGQAAFVYQAGGSTLLNHFVAGRSLEGQYVPGQLALIELGSTADPAKLEAAVNHLREAIERSSLAEETQLYRGVADIPDNTKSGDEMQFKSFFSTSRVLSVARDAGEIAYMSKHGGDDEAARNNTWVMNLTAPAGAHGLDINASQNAAGQGVAFQYEHEVLFAPGTRVKVKYVDYATHHLKGDILGPLAKFNPNHDDKGRFSESDSYAERGARFMQHIAGELELGVEGLDPKPPVVIPLTAIEPADASPELPMSMPHEPPGGPLVYHGTSSAMMESIERNGLVARGGPGADQWAQEHPEYFSPGGTDPGLGRAMVTNFANKPASLFFAANPQTAFEYAQYASKLNGSTPVVFPVHLTRGVGEQLAWDAAGSGRGEMKLSGEVRIPSAWVGKPAVGLDAFAKLVDKYNNLPDDMRLNEDTSHVTFTDISGTDTVVRDIMGKGEAGDVIMFALLFADDPTLAKYNHSHDDKGRFAESDGGGSSFGGAEEHALGYYSVTGNQALNAQLRHGTRPDDPGKTAELLSGLDSAFRTVEPLTEDTTVYRGITGRAADLLEKALGKTFVDKGFVSTSQDEDLAADFAHHFELEGDKNPALVEILLPKGSKAIDMQPYSEVPDELEMLLKRGGTFAVDKVVRPYGDDGPRHFSLRLIK